ncbi:MAG: hypothetical protein IKR83_06790, partial [Bacteroidales bacterium]|nr:hypothetical protein [Bacteroidales bacterium]
FFDRSSIVLRFGSKNNRRTIEERSKNDGIRQGEEAVKQHVKHLHKKTPAASATKGVENFFFADLHTFCIFAFSKTPPNEQS